MSLTITQLNASEYYPNATSTGPTSLCLAPRAPLKKCVAELTQKMSLSQLFSTQALQEIGQFSQKFEQLNLGKEDSNEQASLLLCFLLCDVVRKALDNEAVPENLLPLTGFEEAILDFLKKTVPDGESVDLFIQEFEDLTYEKECFDERYGQIEACFEKQMRLLYQAANEVNREIVEKFEELKMRILEVNVNRQLLSEEANAKIDILTVKVETIVKTLEGITLDQEKIASRMQADQQAFDIIAEEFESVLRI